jgi:MoxR-like ATPase
MAIVRSTTGAAGARPSAKLTGAELLDLQALVRRVPAGDHVLTYALALSRATRPDQPEAPDFVREFVSWGAGPRASQHLVLGAKARAALYGRSCATTEDVAAIARPVLRHRVIVNFNAEAEGLTPDTIADRLLERTPRLAEK